jgi:4-hydroxythreonine-4-phosphate dehydrogenase
MNTFIFTCGDINGIGPEIVIKTMNRIVKNSKDKFLFVCPQNVFDDEIKKNSPNFDFEITSHDNYKLNNIVSVLDIGKVKRTIGKPTIQSGKTAMKALDFVFNKSHNFSKISVITAPISKTALMLVKSKFPGHTEMFAAKFRVDNFAMLFLSKNIRAALLTIHIPLKRVASQITDRLLQTKIELIIRSLKRDFRIPSPKIAIMGLNPHAGENGIIGSEEEQIIEPFIRKSSYRKFLFGPFSTDAFWGMKMYLDFDMIVGMYHDQILNPFKLLNFNKGVNFTAGLPIVRTSPDHGTAFDIAGKGIADESSMVEAYKYAKMILQNRQKYDKNN